MRKGLSLPGKAEKKDAYDSKETNYYSYHRLFNTYLPPWDKSIKEELLFYIDKKVVSETEYRKYLRSSGRSYKEIENLIKDLRELHWRA